MWRQIVAVTQMNLANLRSRVGASAIIVVGMAGVVAVLLGLLAMSSGFRAVLADITPRSPSRRSSWDSDTRAPRWTGSNVRSKNGIQASTFRTSIQSGIPSGGRHDSVR